MFKILNKIHFSANKNKMQSIASTKVAIEYFNSSKSKNLKFLLNERFGWMNKFINEEEKGIEVGSGAGFAKFFISNKNFKTSDLSDDEHLDFKNVDAQNTKFEELYDILKNHGLMYNEQRSKIINKRNSVYLEDKLKLLGYNLTKINENVKCFYVLFDGFFKTSCNK